MSSTSQGEMEAWSSAQLGEMLDTASPEDLVAIREAGILPEQVAGTLARVEEDYDPEKFEKLNQKWKEKKEKEGLRDPEIPQRAENLEKYQEVVKYWTSKVISKAIHNGHDRVVNRIIGVIESETSIEQIDSYIRFSRWVIREAGVTYLVGHMGSGKTDFALLMGEIFYKQLRDDRNVHIASNIKSASEDQEVVEYIDTQPGLQEWLNQNQGPKFFIFDEASSHASGYAGDSSKVTKQFRSMVRLIRKHDGSMVLIGHDGKDVHPTVRELADFIQKSDKKEATVFESVEDREGTDRKFDVTEIPETSWSYNTKEASSWEWASQEGDNGGKPFEVIVGETYSETELTQKETAEIFEVSQSKVSDCKREFREYSEAEA